jgi:flagellar biosynthesis/type III secretory pathway M-ring protein FliF/YscJ
MSSRIRIHMSTRLRQWSERHQASLLTGVIVFVLTWAGAATSSTMALNRERARTAQVERQLQQEAAKVEKAREGEKKAQDLIDEQLRSAYDSLARATADEDKAALFKKLLEQQLCLHNGRPVGGGPEP